MYVPMITVTAPTMQVGASVILVSICYSVVVFRLVF